MDQKLFEMLFEYTEHIFYLLTSIIFVSALAIEVYAYTNVL